MRADKIREAKQAQPFKPFVMHLADGREFSVNHPDFLFVGPVARIIILEDLDGRIEIIDPMMVTSLSVAASEAKSPTG